MIGDLTDKMTEKGTYITSFISGGPQFYAYKFKTHDKHEECVYKIKEIRLNYTNSEKINFASIQEIFTKIRVR